MPRTGSPHDIEHFDDWESFTMDDDIYAGTESDALEDWEDDGAIAEVRESAPVVTSRMPDSDTDLQLDDESAEVFSLLERSQAKRTNELMELSGPSEDELNRIEEVGIDDYIDLVLSEDEDEDAGSSPDSESNTGKEPLTPFHAERNVQSQAAPSQKLHPLDEPASTFSFSQDAQPVHPLDVASDIETEEIEVDGGNQLMSERTLEHGSEGAIDSPSMMSFGESFGDEEIELVVTPLFEGVACALPTLFDEDGDVEYKTTARLSKRLTQSNVNAIFVATADGEGNTLSRKERKHLVRDIVKSTDALVVVDITTPSTRQSVQLAADCVDVGAQAFVVRLDSSVRDPYVLCEAIHSANRGAALFVQLEGDAQSLPVAPEFLYDLPISGVIDATGDASFFLHLMAAYSGPVYVGSTSLLVMASVMGAAGVVLASAAINSELVSLAFAGDAQAQSELAMWERETGGASARSIKLALESEFLISSTMRD